MNYKSGMARTDGEAIERNDCAAAATRTMAPVPVMTNFDHYWGDNNYRKKVGLGVFILQW